MALYTGWFWVGVSDFWSSFFDNNNEEEKEEEEDADVVWQIWFWDDALDSSKYRAKNKWIKKNKYLNWIGFLGSEFL